MKNAMNERHVERNRFLLRKASAAVEVSGAVTVPRSTFVDDLGRLAGRADRSDVLLVRDEEDRTMKKKPERYLTRCTFRIGPDRLHERALDTQNIVSSQSERQSPLLPPARSLLRCSLCVSLSPTPDIPGYRLRVLHVPLSPPLQ